MSSFFSAYIKSVTSIGICAFICHKITSSTSAGLNKALGFITNLCIFIAVVFPLLFGLKEFNLSIPQFTLPQDSESEDMSGYNTLLELTKVDLEQKIKSEIFVTTGINVTDVCITLHIEENTVYIDKAEISISDDDTAAKQKVSDTVYGLLGVTPEISPLGKENKDNESS